MTHTGGFEGDIWAETSAGDDALERFVEDLVACAPQRARPGEMYCYCSRPVAHVPDQSIAFAGLTNGGEGGALLDNLVDPLLRELAGVSPAPHAPPGDVGMSATTPEWFAGRYETRRTRGDVFLDEDGRLWLTVEERNEARAKAEAAGIPLQPQRHGLRWVGGDTFVVVDSSGATVQECRFLTAADEARFLHLGGRAARRVEST
ncbi:MAG: hypothetical protein ACRD0Z_14990 [Acidimicrobiales bacterium]